MGAIVRKDAVEESLKRGLKVKLRLLVASEELIRVYRLGRSRSRRIHREKNGRSKNKNARGTGCADCGKVNSERKSSQKSKQHHARIPPHPRRIYALFPAYLLINKNGLAFFCISALTSRLPSLRALGQKLTKLMKRLQAAYDLVRTP